MIETFTPSPGVPNAAHARFHAALAAENAKPSNGNTGGQFQTPQTAHHIAMKATEFAKTAAANAPPQAARTGPTVETVREYVANRGKPAPKEPLPYVDGVNNMAKFDADMRAQGIGFAKNGPEAKDKLNAEYRAAPEAQRRNPAWAADWRARYAVANGDSQPAKAEAKPIVPAGTNAPSPAVNTAVDFVLKNSNAEGMIIGSTLPKALTSGYTLPMGAKVHAETAIRMLADARRDGIPQSVVDAYVRSLK